MRQTELFEKIEASVNLWDPAGLLKVHAPDDEYGDEIEAIYNFTVKPQSSSVKILSVAIYNAFLRSFGSDVFLVTAQKCEEVAAKILDKRV